MNTDTLTDRLNALSDAELRKKINDATAWILTEVGYGSVRPALNDFPNISTTVSNSGQSAPKEMPWIGSVQGIHNEVAFAYLRDTYRQKRISEFMGKVEKMAAEFENLGIAVNEQREENEQ